MGFQLDINATLAVGVLLAASCAGHRSAVHSPPRPAPDAPPDVATPSNSEPSNDSAPEAGFATYYAGRFAGRKTASGDRYDPAQLTAAHRNLPFGTMVEVRRSDGRRVVVRINDRGPFGDPDRVIDLSRRAAEELGIVQEGKVRVELRPMGGKPKD